MEQERPWEKLLEQAAKGRSQEYTDKLFVMHNRPNVDWPESVLRRDKEAKSPNLSVSVLPSEETPLNPDESK